LGHIAGNDVVRVDPKKIEAMKNCTHPKTLKRLHGFMGLTNYNFKFFHNYGKLQLFSQLSERVISVGSQQLTIPSKS
jgi:hypothetical protein